MSDSLGTASGRIRIDTSQIRTAQAEIQSASRSMVQSLGAVGVALSAQQLARFVIEAEGVATAYRRQSVAAVSLAGSQARLNELLQVYNNTTGDSIDKATALSDVTRLMAVGFADSTAELEEFVRASRGISVATGQNLEYVTQQLQLAIANQSTMRLDQLGLGVSEVTQRIDELRASNSRLTKEQAYQQAILEIAGEKFGALTDSVEAQATGMERLRKAWKDFRLEVGQDTGGPVNAIAEQWADDINRASSELETFSNFLREVEKAGQRFRFNLGLSTFTPNFAGGSGISDRVRGNTARSVGSVVTPRFNQDQTAAILEWSREVQAIERQAARDRLQATQQYEQQRSQIIRDYGKQIARDAEDFARNRARAEQDYAISLQRVHRDIAQRETRQLEELERTIGEARTDAAERAAERQVALDERIAETRQAANTRIAELEADYNRTRERAQRDHQDRLRDAAANLDAVAIREEQRKFRRSQQEAAEDFNERITKERANEQKRLDELNKAHAKQTADEQKALDKRIRQANDAYVRQLEDARAADAQRIEDMAADFALRKEREDEDRAIRLERLAQDHNDQLAELDRQHALRLEQIDQQAKEELQRLKEQYDQVFHDLGLAIDGYTAKLTLATNEALKLFEALYRASQPQQGPQPLNPLIAPPGQFPSLNSVAPASAGVVNNRTSSVSGVNINIYPTAAHSPYDIAAEVQEQVALLLEGYNP